MKARLSLISLILIAGCDMPRTYTASEQSKIEVADVNARNGLAEGRKANERADELEGRVEDLEARIADLEK